MAVNKITRAGGDLIPHMVNLMGDVKWLKDQVGGSNSRSTSLRQDVDKLLKDK